MKVFLLIGAVLLVSACSRDNQKQNLVSATFHAEELAPNHKVELSQRKVFPFSVVPGGAISKAEVLAMVAKDPIVREHYKGIDLDKLKPYCLTQSAQGYVSYRVGNRIYWTTRRLYLKAGEILLSDGVNVLRGRCGNRVSVEARLPALVASVEAMVGHGRDLPEGRGHETSVGHDLGECCERRHAVVGRVEVQPERIHEKGPHTGAQRADDIECRHVADVPGIVGGDIERVQGEGEDPGVGLHDTDRTRIDLAADRDPDSGADLEYLEITEALGHDPVGVRHHTEDHPSCGERAQTITTARDDVEPERRIGELAVEVAVDLLTVTDIHAARADVGLQVTTPTRGPVGVDVELDAELDRGAVMGIVKDRGVDRDLGACEGRGHAMGLGQQKDAPGIEQHGARSVRHGDDRTARDVPSVRPSLSTRGRG